MTHGSAPTQLDVRAFAQAQRRLQGQDTLARYPRVLDASAGRGADHAVSWSARGEMRIDALAGAQPWLHLRADTVVPLVCQRCLEVVDTPLQVERVFRFVADEATAAAEDDDAPEDLLVLAADFNLHELVEDELVLALPLIARHVACDAPGPTAVQDPGAADESNARPHPFAALAGLRVPKTGR